MRAVGLATMAYYYFDFRDVKKQDCYGLLSSLILQLSAESDSCFNILSQLYSEHSLGVRKPDIDALKSCMMDMLGLPGQAPTYIIVDALDESPDLSGAPSAREEVLELIEELVDSKFPNVHLCVASRPEMDIRVVLEPLTSLKISLHDENGQKQDIIKYINSVVRSDRNMRRWKEEDKQLVIDTLSDKSDGMYVISSSHLGFYNGCLHDLAGFDGLSAKLTGCVALFLRVFGVFWMTCRRRWMKHMAVRC
jgi:hypothetical protein